MGKKIPPEAGRVAKDPAAKPGQRLRVRVTAAAETMLRSGHPWLFASSIRDLNRPGRLGELAIIYDRRDRFLAAGLFDPHSEIRVRVLHAGQPQTLDAAWWATQLDRAAQRRQPLFDDQTDGYRWVHGESDGFPGLVLDRYADTLVMKLYTAAWLPRLDEILSLVVQRFHPTRVVLRLSRNVQDLAQKEFVKADGQVLEGQPLDDPVVFREAGLKFEADVLRGQKTGFFLDQRENRGMVERLASGRRVLNAFSFSGGFSVYAARGGARLVVDLDLSTHALASARRNRKLNVSNPAVTACEYEQVKADAFEWLDQSPTGTFDLIVLDPPSLARREAERAGAIRAYEKLAVSAIRRLANQGILVACSCSAHVTAGEFFNAIRRAWKISRRGFAELQTTGPPADHPAAFKEAEYLKAIYVEAR